MNDKKTIEKIIERNQKISERNYSSFQQSGIRRYLREHEKAEDIIDVCTLALNATEEHTQLVSLKFYVGNWGARAISLLHSGVNDEDVKGLLKDIKAIALMNGLASDPWRE